MQTSLAACQPARAGCASWCVRALSVVDRSAGGAAPRWAADEALTQLYAAHWAGLVRLSWLLVRDQHVAEESCRTRSSRCTRRWPSCATPKGRSPTCGARCQHLTLGPAPPRCRAPLPARGDDGARPRTGSTTEPSAEDRAVLERAPPRPVIAALGRLPRRQREVLMLRYYADLSEAQIADALGISPARSRPTPPAASLPCDTMERSPHERPRPARRARPRDLERRLRRALHDDAASITPSDRRRAIQALAARGRDALAGRSRWLTPVAGAAAAAVVVTLAWGATEVLRPTPGGGPTPVAAASTSAPSVPSSPAGAAPSATTSTLPGGTTPVPGTSPTPDASGAATSPTTASVAPGAAQDATLPAYLVGAVGGAGATGATACSVSSSPRPCPGARRPRSGRRPRSPPPWGPRPEGDGRSCVPGLTRRCRG